MKRIKILSLMLALVMLMAIAPMGAVTASAAATDIPDMPSVSPDGTIGRTVAALDFSDSDTGSNSTAYGVISDGMYKVVKGGYNWINWDGEKNTPVGATGMMFYVESAGGEDNSPVSFGIKFNMGLTRSNNTKTWFCNAPTDENGVNGRYGSTATNTSTVYYYNEATGEWNSYQKTGKSTQLTYDTGSGWYYIPMTSFFHYGVGGSNYDTNDKLYGYNYNEVMDHCTAQNINKFQLHSNYPEQKFGDVYFVYPEYAAADTNSVEADAYPELYVHSKEGSATGTVADGAMTVGGMANNSSTVSLNRVWVRNSGSTLYDMTKASGIKFYVDTTALGDAGLQLRIRLLENTKPSEMSYKQVPTKSTEGYVDITSAENIQFSLCSGASVAYYYNENGDAVAVRNASLLNNVKEGDVLEALPVGYKGYVYIPMDSFYASMGGSYGSIMVPFDTAVEEGIGDTIVSMAICHVYSGTPTEDAVVYSDFSFVYDTAIDNISVTVKNDLSMNVYADIEDGAENFKVLFNSASGTRTLEGVEQTSGIYSGLYKFSYDGILPQNMVDTFDITLSADIGGITATKTIEDYSVRANLEALLAQEDDAELKTLIVDMLLYGDAAQNYANYKKDDLASKNLTADDLLLASAEVNKDGIASVKAITGTAADGYAWNTANLRLGSYISVKVGVTAPAGTVVVASIGGNETECEIVDGYAIFDNIGAYQLGETITFTFKNGADTVGQTFTYSVNDYIKEEIGAQGSSDATQALVKALYSYGASAAAYNS